MQAAPTTSGSGTERVTATTSLAVIANLAASLSTQSKNANLLMYWDAGHGANEDSADFIKWVGTTTGYSK